MQTTSYEVKGGGSGAGERMVLKTSSMLDSTKPMRNMTKDTIGPLSLGSDVTDFQLYSNAETSI
jgi:hypothetical protein